MHSHTDLRIGTLVKGDGQPAEYIRQIRPHGFESFQITFWRHLGGVDLGRLADDVARALDGDHRRDGMDASSHVTAAPVVSALGIYGNPLTDEQTARDFATLIEAARSFGCDLVCGFAGRLTNRPVPESLPAFKQVFGSLSRRAEDCGVRIALENCNMDGTWDYGDWNIAHAPDAWEMMFQEVPSPALGLEWEPCHQMISLVDPLPQLRQWVNKVFHVHGKDANVQWDVVQQHGIRGSRPYAYHRTPGFGDTDWTQVISILRQAGFQGAIDIEGWHDPVYRDELEMTGQVHALQYLKRCRGGEFVPNPK